eukprot:CAMPEP_0197047768 /NCGR_PEP_ID=MMETSP1384-20130603/23220_1 /TAXON_ID=29189 /ORGANISM="Ammonia sp." /LENGTH=889 /DNA_ID=CAMNT_0042479767 /DNA_START=357 /DNA_END=3026 /DNA_ORIENTATION=+
MSLIAILGVIVFYCQKQDPNDQNQGLEVVAWVSRGRGYKQRLKYLLLLLTTLYLPVFRDIVLSLSCDIKFYPADGDCESSLYSGLAVLSVLAILLYIVPFPIVLYRLVQRNKPVPSLFDAEGNQRVGGYTESDYRADLDKDECPYKVLYDGYERDWAFYKVFALVIKIVLIMPVVLFVNTNKVGDRDPTESNKSLLAAQSIWTIVVLLVYSGFSTYSQPFIKDSDDQVDLVSRYTALAVAVLGCIASQVDGGEVAFGVLLNLVTFVGGIVIVFYVLSGFRAIQVLLQKIRQKVSFTPTRDTNEPMIFSTQLDMERERKFRIWHEFWDTIFSQDEEFRIPADNAKANKQNEEDGDGDGDGDEKKDKYEPKILGYQYGGSPPYLLNFDGTVGERHAENKEIIEHESFHSYRDFLAVFASDESDEGNQALIESMKYIICSLNGVDVFWDGSCMNLNDEMQEQVEQAREVDNCSVTKFGKLYIIPFPFCAVFVSDDSENAKAVFSISPVIAGRMYDAEKGRANVLSLADRNKDSEIQRRKETRLKLRALDGSMCHWPIQKWVSKSISRTVKQGEETKHERKTVQVLFSFNDGRFGVSQGSDAQWKDVNVSRGFTPNLHYNDGTGSHSERGWGDYSWNNESITVHGDDFGLNAQYEETEVFMRFMHLNYKQDIHESKKQDIIAQFVKYRQHYMAKFVEKEQVLSYAFWYYVYNNDSVSSENLKALLQCEQNEKLKNLATDPQYIESVNMIYDKLRFFNTSQKHSFWFIFWHDLWMNNMLMQPFAENEAFLSPFKHTSICYNDSLIENKQALIEELTQRGLHKRSNAITKGWINSVIVDLLYAKMEQFGGNQEVIEVAPRASTTTRLASDISVPLEQEYAQCCNLMSAKIATQSD